MKEDDFVPSGVLARAAEHYDRMRGQTVEVPEWGTTVHYDPITSAQGQKIQRRANGDEAKALALTVILLAKDAEGKPLFEDSGQTLAYLLRKVDPRVTARIGKAILGVEDREAADLGE